VNSVKSAVKSAMSCTLVASLVLFGSVHAPAASLSAGAARANITPDPGIKNWVTDKPYGSVLDSVYVRALVLDDGKRQIAILSCDLLNTTESGVARLRQAVHDSTGIPVRHILVNASHSHSAPLCPWYDEDGTLSGEADYLAWAKMLPRICADVTRSAQADLEPAVLSVGRAYAGEWLFNRRPISPVDTVSTTFVPENPYALPDGLRFRPFDPTMMVLSVTDTDSNAIGTIFSLPCHAVSNYKETEAISAGWPGAVCENIEARLGGQALFLQGCAGDIVPSRRGLRATEAMGRFFANRALAAHKRRHPLRPSPLSVAIDTLVLPLDRDVRERWEKDSTPVEIQVVSHGPLAIVALPGEPLVALAGAIQDRSPFPHTLVLGYTNGYGVGYVGLPGEMALGGYESTRAASADESGLFIVETAARLLSELHNAQTAVPAEQDSVGSGD
jgi:neutral ceramidase